MKKFTQFLCIFLFAVLSFGTLLASSRPAWSPPIQKYHASYIVAPAPLNVDYVQTPAFVPIHLVAYRPGNVHMRTFTAPPLRFDAIPTRYIQQTYKPMPEQRIRGKSYNYLGSKYFKTTAYNTEMKHLHLYTVRWC